jgi:7-cyano-7-deazaguanine synthase
MRDEKRAVILLSGGLDSATAMAVAKDRGFTLYALTVDYGQRHRIEIEAAARVAKAFSVVRHETLSIDLRAFGKSALTDRIDVPKDNDPTKMADEIPVTYVPARNTIMLSLALAFAETIGALDLFAGMNAVDYSGYPDCRPEFLRAFEETANLGTKIGVEGKERFQIHTPLIDMTKADIIRLGNRLGVNYGITHSCYDPDQKGRACGHCDSCLLRKNGFSQAGVPDPTVYVEMP